MKLRLNKSSSLIAAITLCYLFFGMVYFSIAQETSIGAKKEENQGTEYNEKQTLKEDWFKFYVAPLVPIIAVLITLAGGAILNHFFWKKRESSIKRSKIFDGKIKSYMDLCSAFAEFNAYTDLIMRIEEKNENSKENDERVSVYQSKRNDALTAIRRHISYSQIFYSIGVKRGINSYFELYEKIRTNEIEWGSQAFDEIIKIGRKIASSMEKELRKDLKLETQK